MRAVLIRKVFWIQFKEKKQTMRNYILADFEQVPEVYETNFDKRLLETRRPGERHSVKRLQLTTLTYLSIMARYLHSLDTMVLVKQLLYQC